MSNVISVINASKIRNPGQNQLGEGSCSLVEILGPNNCSEHQIKVTFNYLFRKITNAEFREAFDNGLKVKRNLDRSGYVLFNCKLFAYAHHYAKLKGKKGPAFSAYGVRKEDAKILRQLDLKHIPRRFKPMTLHEFATIRNSVVWSPGLDVYIGKFVSKKHRFIYTSGAETRSDIESDLRAAALYNLYRMYPYFDSALHMTNIAKSAIKRAGQDIISAHTRKKNRRLIRHQDGTFESTLVPLESTLYAQLEATSVSTSRYDELGMRELVQVLPKMTAKAQKFVTLLSGQFDEDFSLYLGRNNEQVAERMPFDAYCRKVQLHLGVTEDQKLRFFQKLKARLT